MTARASAVDQMMRRTVAFVEDRLRRGSSREVTDIRPAEEIASEGSDRRYLSIAELALPRPPNIGDERDYLVVMMLTPPRQEPAWSQPGPLTVLAPDTLRSSRRETKTAVFMNDLVVAADAGPFDFVSVLVYACARNQSALRLAASVEGVVVALGETDDYVRALSLSQALMDRIEVLEQSGDADIVLAGNVSGLSGGTTVHHATCFVALVDEEIAGDAQRWWARGSNLQVGDKAYSTEPVSGGGYLLLRYGDRPTQSSVRRYIDELRRRHALKREELRAGDLGEAYRSYIEKEIEKRKRQSIDALYGHQKDLLPVTTPIALEVARNLKSVVALGTDPDTEFQKLLNTMREAVRSTYGVYIPGLRVRLNESDLPTGTYIIMINEIPLVSGNIALDQRLCDETVDHLSLLNLKGKEAVHPGDGHDCSWIPQEQAELVHSAGITTWGPADCIMLHLETVLRRHLAVFMGIDELAGGLGDDAEATDLLKRLGSARGGVARFRNVIVALLDEELPARPLRVLARQYLERVDAPAYDVAEELRLIDEVNDHLIQDAGSWEVFALADEYVDLIRQHIKRREDAAVLALEPESTQEALTAVRNTVGNLPSGAHRPVILVENWRIRPFVKKLIEHEFPRVTVVARREVWKVDAERVRPQAMIAME